MEKSRHSERLDRLGLSIVLTIGGFMLGGVFGITSGLASDWSGLPSDWSTIVFYLSGSLGLGITALAAPKVIPLARSYSRTRLFFATLGGVLLGVALERWAEALGLDSEALSRNPPSRWAIAEEATIMGLFFGGMIMGAFVVLRAGRRTTG